MLLKEDIKELNKHALVCNFINDRFLEKYFREYDEKILKKRFDDAYELSLTENILSIDTINLKNKEIIEIIDNFIDKSNAYNFIKDRYLYELLKVSNNPYFRLEKTLSIKKNEKLYCCLKNLVEESNYMSADFLIMRCADNFIVRTKDAHIGAIYRFLVKKILEKMIKHSYFQETKENTSSVLCWLDRIVCAKVNLDISIKEFILICKNILNTSFSDIDILWKFLHIINYLSFHEGFYGSIVLGKFKREILKKINIFYANNDIDQNKALQVCIKVLAKNTAHKEDFYNFFSTIKKLAEKSEKDKEFAIILCEYTLYMDKNQNIFCYRFVRENFMTLINKLVIKEDSIAIKEKELHLLINMFYNSPFFSIHKQEIYEKILSIMVSFPSETNTGLLRKYYKYCDILDFILAKNREINYKDLLDKLTDNRGNKDLIRQRFDLLFKNAV